MDLPLDDPGCHSRNLGKNRIWNARDCLLKHPNAQPPLGIAAGIDCLGVGSFLLIVIDSFRCSKIISFHEFIHLGTIRFNSIRVHCRKHASFTLFTAIHCFAYQLLAHISSPYPNITCGVTDPLLHSGG